MIAERKFLTKKDTNKNVNVVFQLFTIPAILCSN